MVQIITDHGMLGFSPHQLVTSLSLTRLLVSSMGQRVLKSGFKFGDE